MTQFHRQLISAIASSSNLSYLELINSFYAPVSEIFMPNFQERIAVGNIITNGIWQSTGGRYRVSSEAQVNGLISGTSGDYAAGQDNIQLVYSIFAESGGSNGWDGPVSDINRIVDEIFAGVVALGNYVHGLPMPDAMEEETSA